MPAGVAILTFALVAFVVLLVSAPLRRGPRAHAHAAELLGAPPEGRDAARQERELDQLEAAREAKYREIRDCELDFRTGKLSRADYEATDAQLRAEALDILDRLELLQMPVEGEPHGGGGEAPEAGGEL